jgi:hypothetical protein
VFYVPKHPEHPLRLIIFTRFRRRRLELFCDFSLKCKQIVKVKETLSEFDDEIEFCYFLRGEGEVKGLVVAVDVV